MSAITYAAIRKRVALFESVAKLLYKRKQSDDLDAFVGRLAQIKDSIDKDNPETLQFASDDLDILEQDFTAACVYPIRRKRVLRVWGFGLLAMLFAHLVLGENALLAYMNKAQIAHAVSGPLFGHFIDYLPFKYILYGAIVGTCLILTINSLKIQFNNFHEFTNLLSAPTINFILTVAVSYVFFRLVKEGFVSFDLIGLKMNSTNIPGGAVFLATTLISLASDRYAEKLTGMAGKELKLNGSK